MAAKKRTIYYYSPSLKDKDEKKILIPDDFWQVFWERVHRLNGNGFEFKHYGSRYVVRALENVAPAVKYVYIGKVRSKEDWPDVETEAEISRLEESGIEGHLVEAAYLVEAGHLNVAAIARTSGGPSTSAIAQAVSEQLKTLETGNDFNLIPFVREDQFRRLAEADGATRIDLKLSEDAEIDDLVGTDQISRALVEAKSLDSNNEMSIGIMLSFGNFTPPIEAQKKLQNALRLLVGDETDTKKFDKAEATLTKIDPDGKVKKESVDFISDRITVKGKFDANENEQPKPEDILKGIMEANNQFREKIGKTS